METGKEMYGTSNIAHSFSQKMSLNDWMKYDQDFFILDQDWIEFLNTQGSYFSQLSDDEQEELLNTKFNVVFLAKHDNK